MKDPRDIILAPVVSEKSYELIEEGVYTFKVHPSASKPEIRDAVEAIWGVEVLQVNTLNRKGKKKPRAQQHGEAILDDPRPAPPPLRDASEERAGASGAAGGQDTLLSPQGGFTVLFYVDFEGSLSDKNVQNALRHLQEISTFLRVLGSYPFDAGLGQ